MTENEVKTSIKPPEKGSNSWLGRYAVSVAGHDAGRVYVIVGIAAVNAVNKPVSLLLADGRSRGATRPKLKKLCHVRLLGGVDEAIKQKLTAGGAVQDAELVNSIKRCKAKYALH